MSYKPKYPIRIITAASLFDGHDASINVIRRMLQDYGAEVIHLGHNRSVMDVVRAALQEGVQGIAISSYQGGHMEYFKYLRDLLNSHGAEYIKIFGGGGGVIVHDEKDELEKYGITRIYHPDDGRRLGLEGMISEIIEECDFEIKSFIDAKIKSNDEERAFDQSLGVELTYLENKWGEVNLLPSEKVNESIPVLGITGTGGAGKSSLIDELLIRIKNVHPSHKVAVLCVDPSKRKTGGALLGDRIRMNSMSYDGFFMRSLATRESQSEIASSLQEMVNKCRGLDFDLIICETSGIGQASSAITELANISLYVMTSDFGAQSQLEKIDMIDYADLIAVNKADRRGSEDALRDVKKQYRRSRKLFEESDVDVIPVYLTQASHFNDKGVNELFSGLCDKLVSYDKKWQLDGSKLEFLRSSTKQLLIPPERQNYLALAVDAVRKYKSETETMCEVAEKLGAIEALENQVDLSKIKSELESQISESQLKKLKEWEKFKEKYSASEFEFEVRGKSIKQPFVSSSLSGTEIPRVILPNFKSWGDRLRYLRMENVPGHFPYTAGVFPLKRVEEEPKRQFAGEGPPERTNRRFHYLSNDDKAKRLSTAFDSVTLYGEDPNLRPDIYGKVGESGVSICTLTDMKKLLDGFDLLDPLFSLSMTINGPAPIILAFFLNAAIDYAVDKKEKVLGRKLNLDEWSSVKSETLSVVRGTVQADILKEDQAQNTCIFSTDFALKMMGDIQEYFIDHNVRNFYSVSISGYHIAEAGANPITQLALTLSNGLTYVEYYLARGMNVDDFAKNFSFFFSNGLDPEYTVLGRVARRIWAIVMKKLYGANPRSQKLKYHIQTSGRSLHAQEIDFNDIRTTLQALIAIYDNCNSLHTNAYDEAITTPTEESLRRAMAIQMIVNREFGMTKNENPLQGSYFVDWLTDKVEESVLNEFMRINDRGGVLGSMETQYQRGKIQEESLYYEHLKHSGAFPVIGVNTFIDPKTLEDGYKPPKIELARATKEEKQSQFENVEKFKKQNSKEAQIQLEYLKNAALNGKNIFESLMEASRHCSLGQISEALYSVGGQYRRSV